MKVSGHFQGQSTPICTTDKDRVVLEPGAQSWAELFRIFWAIVYIFFLVHYELVKTRLYGWRGDLKLNFIYFRQQSYSMILV